MAVRCRFFGAAGEVTGSCTLVETDRARVLVDFGMHQGGMKAERRNRRMPPIRARDLDAIVLTHAHIDHSGRLPLLAFEEYEGPIYATPASIDLADILLKDAAHIQQMDAERASRGRRGRGRRDAKPLYGLTEAQRVLELFRPLPYDQPQEIAPGITLGFRDAGHILGSAWASLDIDDPDGSKRIVFSGDIGPYGAPLLRDPAAPPACDLLILESTYGDRDHRSVGDSVSELASIMLDARTPKGKVIIPSFAVGRTQQLIYFISRMLQEGKVPDASVYIDSPMAIEATTLYRSHREVFDDDCWAIINAGDSCLSFEGLRFSRSADDSRALNRLGHGVVVISASGMCTGGRILHHLRHNLDEPTAHVVFVGYQGDGTLGRRIVNGEDVVRVFGERISVRAHVHTLGGFSAHAGQSDLVRWARPALESGPRLVLNHGEDRQRGIFAELLERDFGVRASLPQLGDIVEL